MEKNRFQWKKVCIVGLGGHAKNRLIPAIENSILDIEGIVSRQRIENFKNYKIYDSIENAIKKVSSNTLFIVSTPPLSHFQISKKILENGFDLFVEKPAFMNTFELKILQNLANEKKLILYEMFMYLETNTFEKAFEYTALNANKILKVKGKFLIPQIPNNTFRNEKKFANSLLLDMGCYPLSLITYLNLNLNELKLEKEILSNNNKFIYEIKGIVNNFQFKFLVGCCSDYKNKLTIELVSGEKVRLEPFFHGIESKRLFTKYDKENKSTFFIEEENAFLKLFNKPRQRYLYNQNLRFKKMLEICTNIELIEKISNFT